MSELREEIHNDPIERSGVGDEQFDACCYHQGTALCSCWIHDADPMRDLNAAVDDLLDHVSAVHEHAVATEDWGEWGRLRSDIEQWSGEVSGLLEDRGQ